MNLLSISFFQDPTYDKRDNVTICKMHDLVKLVARTEITMGILDAANVHEGILRVSFDCNFDTSWKIPLGLARGNQIITFLLLFLSFQSDENILNESHCEKLLSKFCCLGMLDLSNAGA